MRGCFYSFVFFVTILNAGIRQSIVLDPEDRKEVLDEGKAILDPDIIRLEQVNFKKINLFGEPRRAKIVIPTKAIQDGAEVSIQIEADTQEEAQAQSKQIEKSNIQQQVLSEISKKQEYQPKGKFFKRGKPYLMIGFYVLGEGDSFEVKAGRSKYEIFIDSIGQETYTLRLGEFTLELPYPFSLSIH